MHSKNMTQFLTINELHDLLICYVVVIVTLIHHIHIYIIHNIHNTLVTLIHDRCIFIFQVLTEVPNEGKGWVQIVSILYMS